MIQFPSLHFAKETLVDVALDLGLPPVLHERKPGDHEVTLRELDAAELTQEELLGTGYSCWSNSISYYRESFMEKNMQTINISSCFGLFWCTIVFWCSFMLLIAMLVWTTLPQSWNATRGLFDHHSFWSLNPFNFILPTGKPPKANCRKWNTCQQMCHNSLIVLETPCAAFWFMRYDIAKHIYDACLILTRVARRTCLKREQKNLWQQMLGGSTGSRLDAISCHQLLSGRWTSDNRTGISGTLHRVSRILDPTDSSVVPWQDN